MKVQFANGKVYDATDVDDAIAQCLAKGDDPFKPEVIETAKLSKKAETVEVTE